MQNEKYYVHGQIVIPVYIHMKNIEKSNLINHVSDLLNRNTISVIHGDIHTWNGKEYPIIARRCRTEWFEVVNGNDMY